MSSLSSSGTPLTQPTNYVRFSQRGNRLIKSNTHTDEDVVVSNSGFATLYQVEGVSLEPGYRTLLSGLPLVDRELHLNPLATGLVALDRLKFIDSSGNWEYKVTRAQGIHTSVSRLIAEGGQEAFRTISERKVFFLDSDRTLSSGFADWNIFDANGNPGIAGTGVSDTTGPYTFPA